MNDPKQRVAEALAEILPEEGIVGVGTGSTVDIALRAWAERLGAKTAAVRVVATSQATEVLCREYGFLVLDAADETALPLVFDGADQVDGKRAIKGGGGAMRREKTVALRGKRVIFLVDEKKLATELGAGVPVPVEIDPACRLFVTKKLEELGATQVTLRRSKGGLYGPVLTELGAWILDAEFSRIPAGFDERLKTIHGVFSTGIFENIASEIWVGYADHVERRMCPPA